MTEFIRFAEAADGSTWSGWPHTLFCRTLIDTPDNRFNLDISKKQDPPCPGANYVCFGYAQLAFDPMSSSLKLAHEVVTIALEDFPWTPKTLVEGKPLMRFYTMGYLFNNMDKKDQAIRTVMEQLETIMARTIQDMHASLWTCALDNFVDKESYRKALARD